jgi:hypothetical protein
MACYDAKQEELNRVLNHVRRYQSTYDGWFSYYKPPNISLSSLSYDPSIGVLPVTTTIEFSGRQTSYYNLGQTSFIGFGKNEYIAQAGYTLTDALYNTNRHSTFILTPESVDLKVGSLSALSIKNDPVSNEVIAQIRVPVALSATSNQLPALQIFGLGLGNALEVNDIANDTTPFVVTSAGRIGIGTRQPENELHVNGSIRLDGTNTGLIIFDTDDDPDNKMWLNAVNNKELYWQAINDVGGGGGDLFKMIRSGNQIQSLQGVKSGNGWFTINNTNQRVGINILTPEEALTVVGNISASGKIIGGNMSGASLSSVDLTVDTGDLTINNGGLNVKGTIKSKVNNSAVLIGGDETGVSGNATGEGFRITYDSNDLLRFIKTDNNSTNPDGGIDFANLGSGGTIASVMRITGTGRVGINDTAPDCALEIKQDDSVLQGVQLLLSQTNTVSNNFGPKICFDHSASVTNSRWTAGIYDGTTDFTFNYNGSTASFGTSVFVIDKDGNVTASGDINGSDITGDSLTIEGAGSISVGSGGISSSGNITASNTITLNAGLGTISTTGDATFAGTTYPSDARIKENVQLADLDRCYEIVKGLPLKRFTFKNGYTSDQSQDQSKLGWIAQEVQPIFPKTIKQTSHFANTTGIEDLYTLNPDQIYAALYGTVQKLMSVIEGLEERVKQLENS